MAPSPIRQAWSATNEALTSIFPAGKVPQIANGYACAYPLGVLGIIGATILIRFITKTKLEDEEAKLDQEEAANPHAKPTLLTLQVGNAYLAGRTMMEVSEFLNRDIVCTRLMHDGKITIPQRDTKLELGDDVYIVCAEADAEAVKAFIDRRRMWNGTLATTNRWYQNESSSLTRK